ncbi:MAG: hypothetical protein IPF49_12190 [Gammaproteobacteria bacterium]|nr:hypothetical protein [Gammaproteobacteria bacterium]
MLYATGIRRIELSRLDLRDVDLEVGTVVVRRARAGTTGGCRCMRGPAVGCSAISGRCVRP